MPRSNGVDGEGTGAHCAVVGGPRHVVPARAIARSAEAGLEGGPSHYTVPTESGGPCRQAVSQDHFDRIPLIFTKPALEFRLPWGKVP